MVTFIAFLRRRADGGCTVEFPDLPGCSTVIPHPAHPAHVAALAGDELVRYLSVFIQFGEPLPVPSSGAHLAYDPRRGDADVMAFDVEPELLGLAQVPHALRQHTL